MGNVKKKNPEKYANCLGCLHKTWKHSLQRIHPCGVYGSGVVLAKGLLASYVF